MAVGPASLTDSLAEVIRRDFAGKASNRFYTNVHESALRLERNRNARPVFSDLVSSYDTADPMASGRYSIFADRESPSTVIAFIRRQAGESTTIILPRSSKYELTPNATR
jgi:hypothetical protein